MAEETTKPGRKRWRWSIAGVLLIAAVFVTWWNYPRGDPRFVGKWKISLTGRELSLWTSGAGVQSITFMDNSPGKMRLNWRVENGQLCFGGRHAAWAIPYLVPLQRLMKWSTGTTTFYAGENKYDILDVTHERIRLHGSGPSGPEDFELTRLPE